ncbi:MAG: metallophosphoesterase [Rickettsiales bacterium]|jgi:predicted MPP superfamily phosphohydrolase|nr:metallophosphoesterase [Rickettsiales bacterium]
MPEVVNFTFTMIELYALVFFIVLSSLFTCAVYFVGGDLASFASLGGGPKLAILLASFLIALLMLWLAIAENIHRAIKHLVFFVLLIYVFIFLCFLLGVSLRLFRVRINMFRTTLVILSVHFCLYCYGYVNRLFPRPTHYRLETTKDVNLKIVFVSDIHMGAVGSNLKLLKKMIDVINDQKADLVLFGGDMVETKVDNSSFSKYAELFRTIKSNQGIYAILGNHEYYTGRTNIDRILEFLGEECGMRVLLDESVRIGKNMVLLGRVDGGHSRIMARRKIDRILEKADAGDAFLLVLDHNPRYFDEAVKNNVDLQLSGHSHNGQMFPFNILVKFFYEKPYGRLEKSKSTLIVSSGVGTWGPPVKLFSKPEIVVLEIKKTTSAGGK